MTGNQFHSPTSGTHIKAGSFPREDILLRAIMVIINLKRIISSRCHIRQAHRRRGMCSPDRPSATPRAPSIKVDTSAIPEYITTTSSNNIMGSSLSLNSSSNSNINTPAHTATLVDNRVQHPLTLWLG